MRHKPLGKYKLLIVLGLIVLLVSGFGVHHKLVTDVKIKRVNADYVLKQEKKETQQANTLIVLERKSCPNCKKILAKIQTGKRKLRGKLLLVDLDKGDNERKLEPVIHSLNLPEGTILPLFIKSNADSSAWIIHTSKALTTSKLQHYIDE